MSVFYKFIAGAVNGNDVSGHSILLDALTHFKNEVIYCACCIEIGSPKHLQEFISTYN